MNFQEAFKLLQDGKYVMRKEWLASGEYCILLPGMPYIWKILLVPNPSAGNWLPLMADLLADDWMTVEEAKALNAPQLAEEPGVVEAQSV